jgi:hypothetical protein
MTDVNDSTVKFDQLDAARRRFDEAGRAWIATPLPMPSGRRR